MYPNLLKKVKKEVGERRNASLQHIRQLLPLPRLTTEVIAVEPSGSITDSKGNKISFDSSVDKKHDLQVIIFLCYERISNITETSLAEPWEVWNICDEAIKVVKWSPRVGALVQLTSNLFWLVAIK